MSISLAIQEFKPKYFQMQKIYKEKGKVFKNLKVELRCNEA